MSVEGVILGFLLNAILILALGAAGGWWLLKQQKANRAVCDKRLENHLASWLQKAPFDHVHEYATPDHDHPHDHPHNHEHFQHTHTLETMSRHEENGRPVFVKFCAQCKTVFRDIPEPQAV